LTTIPGMPEKVCGSRKWFCNPLSFQ
jgi:hypothetical protein